MFELRILGQFRLVAPTGPIELASTKQRALLGYLACIVPRQESRDRLAALLWGSHFEAQAHQNLRQSLVRIRKIIGADALITNGSHIGLSESAVQSDVRQFEALAKQGTAEALRTAANFLNGQLLDGISVGQETWEEWLSTERRRLNGLAADALAALGEIEAADGNLTAALHGTERALQLDPYREDAHRLVMRSLADTGRRSEALKHFQALSDRLRLELGSSPEPATLELWQSLRSSVGSDRNITPTAARQRAATPRQPVESAVSAARVEIPTIAVLPFTNLSALPEQQYFSDGLTEDIITELSRFHDIFVIARNSAFAFRDQAIDIATVAQKLGVRYVVEGSVRREGNRIRVTVQLIDGNNGNHLWAERYDRVLEDVFSVQDEITSTIVATLWGRVEAASLHRASRLSGADLQAYDLILQGRALLFRFTKADNAKARTLLEQALALDPKNIQALNALAHVYLMDWVGHWVLDRQTSIRSALDLGRKALAINDSDSAVRWQIAETLYLTGNHDEAQLQFRKAIDLNPNDVEARCSFGCYLAAIGRPTEGLVQFEEAKRRNPIDFSWMAWFRGFAYFMARQYAEAIDNLLQVEEQVSFVDVLLAASYGHCGQQQEASKYLERFLRLSMDDMAVFPGERLQNWEGYFQDRCGFQHRKDLEHLLDGLRKAGFPQ